MSRPLSGEDIESLMKRERENRVKKTERPPAIMKAPGVGGKTLFNDSEGPRQLQLTCYRDNVVSCSFSAGKPLVYLEEVFAI